ncbi:MAG: divalent-cation tolerance protein CutA [Fibrobacterota bacterium]
MTEIRLIYVVCPDEACARDIGRKMVEQRMAACANILPKMSSIYRWEGKLEEARESLLLLKTVEANVKELHERIRKLHPYRLPAIVDYPATGGLPEYLDWVRQGSSARHH